MLIRPKSFASQTLPPPSARPERPESSPENTPPAPPAEGAEPRLFLRASEEGSRMESSIIPSTIAPSEFPAR